MSGISHLQCMESTVKCKYICLAFCYGELLKRVFMTNTHFKWLLLYFQVKSKCKNKQGGKRGLGGERMCFSFLGGWAMWLRYPRKYLSHTTGSRNIRTAKISQRHGTEGLRPETSRSENNKNNNSNPNADI